MKKDPDLDSIRNRDDFKKLITDLEAAAKQTKPTKSSFLPARRSNQ